MSTLAEHVIATGVDNLPPMLDKIINGPFQYGTVEVPATLTILASIRERTYKDLTEAEKICEAYDIRETNILLQGLPPDVYSLVDVWSEVTSHVRHSRLMDELDKFAAKEGESLESVYERLTIFVNIMDHNNVRPISVLINTKFLNCLQPEWIKYVTMVCHNQTGDIVSYDVLYDSLVQFEPHVLASKAKKATKNHDPLALLAHSNASSSQSYANSSYSSQPYYVTHPSSVVDYDDEYQGELQGDSQEDKLTTAMMLLAQAISQKFSIPTNNRLHISSNIRNQAIVQDCRVDIQTKNIVLRVPRTKSTLRKANVQCYNYNEKGHYARDCQKPRVPNAKYFREQILLAMKDEAESNLNNEENEFMLNTSYGEETMEELTVAVLLMARIQPADGKCFIQEFSVEQTYFSIPTTSNNGFESKDVTSDLPVPKMRKESKLLKMFDTIGVAINGLQTRIDKTLLKDRQRRWMSDSQNSVREFYKTDVIPMSDSLYKNLKEIKPELTEEVHEMLNIFELMEQQVKEKSPTENILQNEIDRLLEVSLTSEIRDCVLLSVEKQKNELLKDEIEKSSSDSKDIQANLLKRIKILENDFKRSQAQSIDFELKLQHQKEKIA
ncbi:putative RNA-directed DNA polymerase [Tanacetum coccineum]